jgi:hypothetical protein
MHKIRTQEISSSKQDDDNDGGDDDDNNNKHKISLYLHSQTIRIRTR